MSDDIDESIIKITTTPTGYVMIIDGKLVDEVAPQPSIGQLLVKVGTMFGIGETVLTAREEQVEPPVVATIMLAILKSCVASIEAGMKAEPANRLTGLKGAKALFDAGRIPVADLTQHVLAGLGGVRLVTPLSEADRLASELADAMKGKA